MSLNSTPSGERVHIGFFGRRNAGKSSVVNAFTNQQISVVSDVKGTTTDPVTKAMELLPLGPVMIIDTPGFDDEGSLGAERVKRTKQVLNRVDIAVLVVDGTVGKTAADHELIAIFEQKKIPCLVAYNKSDLTGQKEYADGLAVSALTKENIDSLKETVARLVKSEDDGRKICADLVETGDIAVLVVPIDKAAPKGRLILPQQLTLRELLDLHCKALCCQVEELPSILASLKVAPKLVVTDSQAFGSVSPLVPDQIPLTSFSILFARYKGRLSTLAAGAKALSALQDGDCVLISEGCTHHRQCKDIGTVKMPDWVRRYTGKQLEFRFSSGGEFPEDLSSVALVIHCGACMLNEAAMQHRMEVAQRAGVPMVNYGMAIAQMHGILARSLEPFSKELQQITNE